MDLWVQSRRSCLALEAFEDARRKMNTFQLDRGLLSESEPTRKITALKAEIKRLEALLKNPAGAPLNTPSIP